MIKKQTLYICDICGATSVDTRETKSLTLPVKYEDKAYRHRKIRTIDVCFDCVEAINTAIVENVAEIELTDNELFKVTRVEKVYLGKEQKQ